MELSTDKSNCVKQLLNSKASQSEIAPIVPNLIPWGQVNNALNKPQSSNLQYQTFERGIIAQKFVDSNDWIANIAIWFSSHS